jgi:glycosyltransferase involved in cell wall biosynthesis
VTASRWTKRDVAQSYGIPAERIAVVNVPPPLTAYAPLPPAQLPALRERLRLPPRFLLYPAQTWPHKNHERLVAALQVARAGGVEAPVVCTGRTTERRAAVERDADRRGVADLLRFVGFLSASELDAVYRASAGLIFPSLFEGWGLPVVEAFAAGVPVACSNVTSLPDLVGDAALLFDPTDVDAIAAAIAILWTDSERASELAARGRARVAALSWPDTARQLRAHYRRVAGIGLTSEDAAILARGDGI